jgi:hypothetical protein
MFGSLLVIRSVPTERTPTKELEATEVSTWIVKPIKYPLDQAH